MKYSIVLPTFPKNNFNLLCKIILPLYKKFLNWKDVHKFYLVTPSKYVEELKLKTKDFCVEVIDEEDVLSTSVKENKGWFKQQLVKINMSSFVETDFYLVLDDDLFLIKPLSFEHFFKDDLIIYSHEKWPNNSSFFATNTSWWENSCRVLGLDISNIKNSSVNMGVTPQLLKKEHCQSLIKELKNIKEDWMQLFCEEGLTEFSSYWVHLKKKNSFDYTPEGNKLWECHLDVNVLVQGLAKDAIRLLVKNALEEKRHFFLVIQSYFNYPSDDYEDLFLKILQ